MCRRLLTADESMADAPVVLGEMAHIVAESPNGPRGDSPLSIEERNRYGNLMLLCNIHHQLIDDQPATYPVERLHEIKDAHEKWVEATLERSASPIDYRPSTVRDTVHSSILPVESMPMYIFGAPCTFSAPQIKALVRTTSPDQMLPFVLHSDRLYAFQDLRANNSPFRAVTDGQAAERYLSREWWADPDLQRWYVYLLNRALNKLTGRRGLRLEEGSRRRYYFVAKAPFGELEIEYRPLNRRKSKRSVVWQPTVKATGAGRGFWYNRGISLGFHKVTAAQWVLTLHPELLITSDGMQLSEDAGRGAQVTRKKARMFNYDLLRELNFWRDYLSDSKARIVFPFGTQSLVINTTMMQADIEWPGIPQEHAKPFKNIEYADDGAWAILSDNGVEDEDDNLWADLEDDLETADQ